MDTSASATATILIATDSVTDATLVMDLLHPEFDHIVISTDPDKAPGDFVRYRPDVLVLAFNTLEKSERYYLELYRMCEVVHQHPHRTVILCNLGEMKQAFELCNVYFDDYMLFWPMTHDTLRLSMSIYHALRELAALEADGPSATEFAAQARHLAVLEKILDHQIAQGNLHIEAASLVMEQAAQEIGTVMDEFSQQLISGVLPGLIEVGNADRLRKEISRFKCDEVQQRFRAAAESIQPLKQWTHELRQECEPILESARILNAMAELILPTVLVVDDNEAQRKILGKLLKAENYHLIFARDGFEALNMLHKTRPDLILMDMTMPNMNGVETTRRLKAISHFSRTPVIMVTGKSEGKVVADSLKAGAVDFVVKPFDQATLIAKIAHALNVTTPA